MIPLEPRSYARIVDSAEDDTPPPWWAVVACTLIAWGLGWCVGLALAWLVTFGHWRPFLIAAIVVLLMPRRR